MTRLKVWLLAFAIALIALDRYSFISKVRDTFAIYLQKQIRLNAYRIKNYPKMVLLQKSEQNQLEQENQQLKKQVEQYSLLLKQQSNQDTDMKAIEDLQGHSELYTNYQAIIARAIVDLNYLVNNRLLIDKGEANAIKVGNAVIDKDGIVGQIRLINTNSSQIILLTSPEFKIYLQNSATKSKMLAQGVGNNMLQVKYIAKTDKIKPGDILTTTGLDDIYPANIPVARVVKIFFENNGFNSAMCEPVVNLNKLQYVLVLKNAN